MSKMTSIMTQILIRDVNVYKNRGGFPMKRWDNEPLLLSTTKKRKNRGGFKD
jgi:hypothetical protein